MPIKKTAIAAAALMLILVTAASAGTKSFVINGSDMKAAQGGAITEGVETFEGVELGDGGFGVVIVNFTLPKDYKKNSPVSIALRMFGGGSSCTVYFYPDATFRYRNNTVKTIGVGDDSGLTADGPVEILRPATFDLIQSRTYKLRKIGSGTPVTGSIRDQRPGDGIGLMFTRHGATGVDTCTSALIINSAKITYTTN